MYKNSFPALCLLTLAFAGCAQQVEPIETRPQPVRPLPTLSTQMQIPTSTTLETGELANIVKDSNPTVVPEVKIPLPTDLKTDAPAQRPPTDRDYYQSAIKNEDTSYCDKITSDGAKDACKRDVAALSEESNPKAVVTTDQGSTSQENL